MRLYEIENLSYYLESESELAIGSIVEQNHFCGLGAAREVALERHRPEGTLARATSLPLHANPDRDADYVYQVRPIGQVDHFHTSWLKKLSKASTHHVGESEHYATGFWSGKPIPDDQNAPWEYRALKVKVLMRVGGHALWMGRRPVV